MTDEKARKNVRHIVSDVDMCLLCDGAAEYYADLASYMSDRPAEYTPTDAETAAEECTRLHKLCPHQGFNTLADGFFGLMDTLVEVSNR